MIIWLSQCMLMSIDLMLFLRHHQQSILLKIKQLKSLMITWLNLNMLMSIDPMQSLSHHQLLILPKMNKVMIMSGEKRTYVSLILINGGMMHQKVILWEVNLGIKVDLLILQSIIREEELLIEKMKISIYMMMALI